jgi:catechol 2,3-dioxygenase-like lactoylglutathione lyase family enzyme
MRIKLSSIVVDDQRKALKFYTEVLGFVKKMEIPMGEFAWLTVVAKDRDDLELSLEPNANPIGKTYQEGLFKQGIPITAFEVDDIDAEYSRLKALGVVFQREPVEAGPVKIAALSDTCGNWIQLYQPPA